MNKGATKVAPFLFGQKGMDFTRAQVMGVLNVTPDSFSDGGRYSRVEAALEQALRMVDDGASIIDIGGESTRPGAAKVSEQQELDRVMPVVERLRCESDVVISLDTSTPVVMREGLALGVQMINDVRAFQREGALEAIQGSAGYFCLMHMQGEPDTMQHAPRYKSVVQEVSAFLRERAAALSSYGIAKEQILLDPGFGFGKTLSHNYSLLKHLADLKTLDFPLLIGVSRKSMIGNVLEKGVEDRLFGSVAAALLALERGAAILRVHDVAPTMDAVKIWSAMQAAE
ncbi:dihydropteroate synthase [Oleiphilus sp. HI0118]|nr:dihydropteroate synthase [Oleiphilus sp. HI0118]